MRAKAKALEPYLSKRDFSKTSEPRERKDQRRQTKFRPLRFVVQKHKARQLHYDFRLELDGLLKSWAVAKGPCLVAGEKRLAVHVEDHPLDYADFEGTIPPGQYGAGAVIVWDRGVWSPEGDPARGLEKGRLSFSLKGKKLNGGFHLVRMRPKRGQRGDNWLLIKSDDEHARDASDPDVLDSMPKSVLTGNGVDEIAKDPPARQWTSGRSGSLRHPRARANVLSSKSAPLKIRIPQGGRKSAPPGFTPPCLAVSASRPPPGAGFIHEVKFDGYRLLAMLEERKVTLQTRGGLNWTEKFSSIAEQIGKLPVKSAVLDGEAVVENESGLSDFAALQEALKAGRDEVIVFYAFDILYLNGYDLREIPLVERKALLERILERAPANGSLRFSAQFDSQDADQLWKLLCRLGAEGIVSKRVSAPYHSGRGGDWFKTKCVDRQEFVIIGYVPSTTSAKAVGSLVLGVKDRGRLVPVGRAGTGFGAKVSNDLFASLEKLRRDKPAADGPIPADAARNVRWVEPQLVAEIEFHGWTANKMVRQAAFKGLREDKTPDEIVREPDARGDLKMPEAQTSIRLTHPDRLLWPRGGHTKQALADYYTRVWSFIAPHIVGRPLALVRCPNGIDQGCFFQKHAGQGSHHSLIRIKDPQESEPLIGIDSLDGLVALAQASVLEIHPWGSRGDALEMPDRLIFDLDPGDNVGWGDVIRAAKELRQQLLEDKLESFVKTTGGKGLHLVVPIEPRAGWKEVKAYCRATARAFAASNPKGLTAAMSKSERRGRIYIDYLRNDRGSTAIAPYSTRARPEASIAMPLDWDELDLISSGSHFTLANVDRRLQNLRSDPWFALAKLKQRLPRR